MNKEVEDSSSTAQRCSCGTTNCCEEVQRLRGELEEAKVTLIEFHYRHCGLVPCGVCGSTDCETVVEPGQECPQVWSVAPILKWYDGTRERRERGERVSCF